MATVRCLLNEAAELSGEQAAVLGGSETYSFAELEREVARTALNLLNAGVQRGDRVLLWMRNGVEAVIALLGVIRMGGLACPLNVRRPIAHIDEAALQLGAKLVLTQKADQPVSPPDTRCITVEDLAGFLEGPAALNPEPFMDAAAPALCIFTSGSSGAPKAAILSYGALYYSARGVNRDVQLRTGDRWLLALPLFHVSGVGIVFRCLMAGASIILCEGQEDLASEMATWRITHASFVPTQLQRTLDSPDASLVAEHLKALLLGGAACPEVLLDKARRMKWPVCPSYGLTEMASTVAMIGPRTPAAQRVGCGPLLHGREVSISASGEILVRGSSLFSGYWQQGRIQPAVDGEGWYATGDLGSLNAQGCLLISGRADQMFISGGENIHPETIEAALLQLSGVAESLVVAIPDAEFGRRPVAFVRMKNGGAPDPDLADRLRKLLPGYMIPVKFYPWPEGMGEGIKVNRKRFEEMLARLHPKA